MQRDAVQRYVSGLEILASNDAVIIVKQAKASVFSLKINQRLAEVPF